MLKLIEKLKQLLGLPTGNEPKTRQQNKENSSEQELPSQKVMVTSIPDTPFGCAKRGENDYVIIFGKHMITNKSFTSPQHAEAWTRKEDWLTILNVIGIYIEEKNNQLNNTTK